MKITLLEDDRAQAEMILQWLVDAGHEVIHATTCEEFIKGFESFLPDMAILDWERSNGYDVDNLNEIRERLNAQIPILFTTQKDAEEHILVALKNGSDDYLVKPFEYDEFSARLQAMGRKVGIRDDSQFIIEGPFEIDKSRQRVTLKGEEIKLTQKDYAVTLCLFQNLGKALSREYLLKSVWGVDAGLDTRTVDMHVSRVRRSLKISPENGFIIKTIYQFGYRLERVLD